MLGRTSVLGMLFVFGCGPEPEMFDEPVEEAPPVPAGYQRSELSGTVDGPWVIPAATLSIGDRQDVLYTGAGAWLGSSGCAGGLTAGAAQLRDHLYDAFSQAYHVGGYACRPINGVASQMSVHATGRALDVHVPTLTGSADNGLGDPIGNWLIENAERIGIQYIIWDRWTWRADRADGDKDRYYSGAHAHHDHLHVELSVAAANVSTDFFQADRCGDATCSSGESCSSCQDDCGACGPFLDVPADHVFVTSITWLRDTGITQGCNAQGTLFCPDQTVTRAQVAAFLTRALDLPATGIDYFDDDDGTVHEGSINRVAAAGITAGCGTRRYCPSAEVTRAQLAAFLARALSLAPTSVDHFDDDDGSTHEGAINKIAAAGITNGCGTRAYCPDDPVTRGQMGAFLYRALSDRIAPPFLDVPLTSPYATAIAWLAAEGITQGCNAEGTLFCPGANVTREQTATFLARALSLPATTTDYFTDDESSVHEASINRIAAAGITSGCGTGLFCPTQDVLRGQMAAFLSRALQLPATTVDHFDDDDGTTFEAAINRIAQAGITSGCGERRFCPDDAVTREQMATFLYRALH